MSGTMSTSCPGPSYSPVVCPPKLCLFRTLDCQDLFSIVIQAILTLKGTQGSSILDIYAEAQRLCPSMPFTQANFADGVLIAVKRGILRKIQPTLTSTPTYMVIAQMAMLNYQNRNYTRLPCGKNSFWTFRVATA